MAVGQRNFPVARQPAIIAKLRGQAFGQQFSVARPGHPVGQNAGEGQTGPVVRQAISHCAESLRHRMGVDERQHRDAEQSGQIRAGRGSIEKPHHAFNQD